MKNFSLKQCKTTEGFFADLQKMNAEVTMNAVYKRFKETGRFDALKCERLDIKTHIFWDSDVAKWLEAAAYLLSRREDPQIKSWYNEAVEDIIANQQECGYFNSYFQVYEPENIFTNRDGHELYCAGHLLEAAVAAKQYLNDDRLLLFADRFVDCICERFVEKKDTAFTTPGHEEIELALFRLYELTSKEKYKELAQFFLNMRGSADDPDVFAGSDYSQSHLPVRKQTEAKGHAVRALYLYTAMADMAKLDDDEELKATCESLFDNIVSKKMYVTGATGSAYKGERFSSAYDLPNEKAYAETCAAIALVLFCDRMLKLTGEAKYGHVIERCLYNGFLAGISLDGNSFFYTNPLEVSLEKTRYNREQAPAAREWLPIIERVEMFRCSCCPPNVCRFLEQIPSYIWYENEGELILSQLISSDLHGENVEASLVSDFPKSGKACVKVNSHGKKLRLKIRIPEWCDKIFDNAEDGYLSFEKVFDGEELIIDFPMKIRKIYSNPLVNDNAGKVALSYGPLILCAEGIDNAIPLSSVRVGEVSGASVNVLLESQKYIKAVLPIEYLVDNKKLYGYEKTESKSAYLYLIPYYAWGNRGETSMKIWFAEK